MSGLAAGRAAKFPEVGEQAAEALHEGEWAAPCWRKNFACSLYLSEGFTVVDGTGPQSDTMLKLIA
jgi:hypothetical protein